MLFPSNFITRKVATPIFTRTRRMFSAGGSHEEHVAEVDRWYKLTIGKLNDNTLRIQLNKFTNLTIF